MLLWIIILFTLHVESHINLVEAFHLNNGNEMLNCLLLSHLATVEVEYEKGTHSRACRMLHLDN
jgi:hypothetical protein